MKYIYIILILIAAVVVFQSFRKPAKLNNPVQTKNFYDLSINDIDGKQIKFSQFKGKKVLLVNVASYCGYTPQYKNLEALHEKYKDKLVVIGFPCNQFGEQEPGTADSIKSFCSANYHITFQMTEKIEVKGSNQHPVYQWLTKQKLNGVENTEVKWNFNKYLVDENGKYIKHFGSKTDPMSEDIISLVEGKH